VWEEKRMHVRFLMGKAERKRPLGRLKQTILKWILEGMGGIDWMIQVAVREMWTLL
jgi:hypothetical protein